LEIEASVINLQGNGEMSEMSEMSEMTEKKLLITTTKHKTTKGEGGDSM